MRRINITGTGVLALLALAGGAYLYSKRGALVSAVNPADPANIVNQSVNRLMEAATGSKPGEVTLGTWLYDLKAKYFPSEADKILESWKRPTPIPPAVNQQILDANDARIKQGLHGDSDQVAKWNAEVWVGLLSIGTALYIHTQNNRRHRRARH